MVRRRQLDLSLRTGESGRKTHEAENLERFHRKWRGKIRPDIHEFTMVPPWRSKGRAPPAAPAIAKSDADLHFAIPLDVGNSFTWVTAQLAEACEDAGMKVSLAAGKLDNSLGSDTRGRLARMMSRAESRKFQVRWSHFWKPYGTRALNGEINAEIFAVNYRYGRQAAQSLDHRIRHTVTNPYRKLPISSYCARMLTDLGVPGAMRRYSSPVSSPEILTTDKVDARFSDYRFVFLSITNSHDPFRYGTDVLLNAYRQAFAGRRDVVLILKDYGRVKGPVDV